jgi:hypothetical protein
MTIASTKKRLVALTYAQIFCCIAVRHNLPTENRYQTNSAPKLLIHIEFINCFFYGQSSESLDLQGLQAYRANLSTKLSTEKLNICKAISNQVLSAFFASFRQAILSILHIFQPAV